MRQQGGEASALRHFKPVMTQMGHSRHFDRAPLTSGLPGSTDIARPIRLVRFRAKTGGLGGNRKAGQHAFAKSKTRNSAIKRIPVPIENNVGYAHCGCGVAKMPIRPPPPMYGDLERARQIARSWKPLDQLSPADAEVVARAIAEGIAEERRHGFEMARAAVEA